MSTVAPASTRPYPPPQTPDVIALPFHLALDMQAALRTVAADVEARLVASEKQVAVIRHAVDLLDTAVQQAGMA